MRPLAAVLVALLVFACAAPRSSTTPHITPGPTSIASPPASQVPSAPVASSSAVELEVVWSIETGLGQPTGIALAGDGSVLVMDFRNDVINRISADGAIVEPWGDTADGDGALGGAAGIAVDAQGFVYVADHQHYRIAKFDSTGAFVASLGSHGTALGQLDAPDGVAIAPDGSIYVSEDHKGRVQVLDATGAGLRELDEPGPGGFGDPTGIALSTDRAYVSDYNLNRVAIYDTGGALMGTFGSPGKGDGQFNGMSLSATDAHGNLYVTDYDNGRIQEFAGDGSFIASFVPADGGHFNLPYGVAVGPDGDLYVSEFGGGRVSRLDRPQ